ADMTTYRTTFVLLVTVFAFAMCVQSAHAQTCSPKQESGKYVDVGKVCSKGGISGTCGVGTAGFDCLTTQETEEQAQTAKDLGKQPEVPTQPQNAFPEASLESMPIVNTSAGIPPSNSPPRIDVLQFQAGGVIGSMFGNYSAGDLTKLPGGGEA